MTENRLNELIKQQNAEIERLKNELEQDKDMMSTILEENSTEMSDLIWKERSIAIMEFAERLADKTEKARQKYIRLCKEQGEKVDEVMNIHFNGIVKIINDLVKEMTEEEE